MVPTINLSTLRAACPPSEDNRQKSLDAVQKFKDAQKELERVCKEQGIEVPVMVCEQAPVRLTQVKRDAITTRINSLGEEEANKLQHHFQYLRTECKSMGEFEDRFDAYLHQWDTDHPV